MHFDELIHFCFQLPGATETFPFDKRTLVIKVQNKMFALIDVEDATSINLKCDPERAIELRERYDGIQPGYHMSKKHWNTVTLDGSVPAPTVREWIGHSYTLIASGLKKADRDLLAAQRGSAQVT